MKIIQLTENKKQHLDLLLLADESESMIDRYLERGEVFVLNYNGVKAICVVTDEATMFVSSKYSSSSRITTTRIW